MFADKTVIHVKAGDGGRGCCSFLREKFIPKGGPDGGDGGPGGNVYIKPVPGEQNLNRLVFNPRHVAERGIHGKGKNMHGRAGKSITINVPIGTIIRNAETGEVLYDLDDPQDVFCAAKGGRGGRGNARFVTATHRIPLEHEPGEAGEEFDLELELKTIADFGLVGYPNAGKSTLITALSNARPKIAPYPFTTLHPVVGIVDCRNMRRFSVADIPGLIEGAHKNVGLGHAFLKHIERTRVLIFVLDMAGVDGRDPLDDYATLKRELSRYSKDFTKRPSIIVANKMDLPESVENLKRLFAKYKKMPIFALSAKNDLADMEDFRDELLGVLNENGGPRDFTY